MNIAYISNSRIPTEKANGKQIFKTCEALAMAGVQVRLIVPNRKQVGELQNIDAFEYYNVKKVFKLKKLSTFDLLTITDKLPHVFQIISYYVQEATFLMSLAREDVFENIVYTRSITSAVLCKLLKNKKVFYEIHNVTENRLSLVLHKFLWSRLDGLVVISKGLEEFVKQCGFNKVTIIPSAVDLVEFKKVGRLAARKKLQLPKNKKLIVYTGSTHERKGVYVLADAAKILSKRNITVLYEGGATDSGDFRKLKQYVSGKKIANIVFAGYDLNFIPPTDVTYYLQAADVLVLPDSGILRERQEFTSPMKLFEYLAVGVPIVASNTKAISSILIDGKNALLFQADDPKDLAKKVEKVLDEPGLALKISDQAKRDSKNYSWSERARKIINFITQ